MPSILAETIFSEPSGRRLAAVQLLASLGFAAIYLNSTLVHNSTDAGWLLFMIGGLGLSAIAESLPAERRRVAGVLRVFAISVLLSLLAIMVAAPELIGL